MTRTQVIANLRLLRDSASLDDVERATIEEAIRLLEQECEPTSISHMNMITNRDRT